MNIKIVPVLKIEYEIVDKTTGKVIRKGEAKGKPKSERIKE